MSDSKQASEVVFKDVGKMAVFKKTHTVILKNCSFTVESGKLTVLIGSSGCGKTTIINLIAGYERPATKTLCLAHLPVRSCPKKQPTKKH